MLKPVTKIVNFSRRKRGYRFSEGTIVCKNGALSHNGVQLNMKGLAAVYLASPVIIASNAVGLFTSAGIVVIFEKAYVPACVAATCKRSAALKLQQYRTVSRNASKARAIKLLLKERNHILRAHQLREIPLQA